MDVMGSQGAWRYVDRNYKYVRAFADLDLHLEDIFVNNREVVTEAFVAVQPSPKF